MDAEALSPGKIGVMGKPPVDGSATWEMRVWGVAVGFPGKS